MNIYDGALWLTGYVGQITDEEFFTQSMVRHALAKHGARPLTVYLNSGGGFCDEGMGIHNLLKAHPKEVTIIVDGMAASIASVIAMAGDEIVMRRGSTMMIHDPSVSFNGTAKEFERTAETLHTQANELAAIYAARTKRPLDEIRALMVAETWYSPEQAVRAGFADRVDTIGARVAASFPYSRVYAHAPQSLQKMEASALLGRLVEQSVERHKPKTRASKPAPVSSPSKVSTPSGPPGKETLQGIVDRANARRR